MQVRVGSYNLLAQSLAKSDQYPYTARADRAWKGRKGKLLAVLTGGSADVWCLQEVENWDDYFKGALDAAGYDGYMDRAGTKRYGCALVWKRSAYRVNRATTVQLDDVCDALSPLHTSSEAGGELPPDFEILRVRGIAVFAELEPVAPGGQPFVVVTTHLFWRPDPPLIKLSQVVALRLALSGFNHASLPTVLGADLNSLPHGPVLKALLAPVPLPPCPPHVWEAHAVGGGDEAYLGLLRSALRAVLAPTDVLSWLEPLPESEVSSWPLGHAFTATHVVPPATAAGASAGDESSLPVTHVKQGFYGILDWILTSPHWATESASPFATLAECTAENGGGMPTPTFPSDHLPITATVSLCGKPAAGHK